MNILVTMPKGSERDTFFTTLSKRYVEGLGNVTYNPYDRNYTKEELKEALKGIDVVFCGWKSTFYDDELLEAADSLKILAYTAGSLARVVDQRIFKKNIAVLGANCVFAESVAEGCLCYAMVGLRKIEKYTKLVRDGGWRTGVFYNEGILHKTVGLVGFGAIAQKFVEYLKPFQVEILVNSDHLTEEEAKSRGVKKATLNEVFENSDVVSIHSSLTERTYHMVGKEQFSRMKTGSLLINTARGAVLDEAELVEELKTGRISAVLDVFEKEPLPEDSLLRTLENVTVLPHMGGPTIDMRQYCVIKLCEDIVKYNQGIRELETMVSMERVTNMTQKG